LLGKDHEMELEVMFFIERGKLKKDKDDI